MPVDPASIIGEVLGQPAAEMRSPVNAENECPHINSKCVKSSHGLGGSVPVCSVWQWQGKVTNGKPASSRLVCVCPKRFFEIDLVNDVLTHCWSGPLPANPQIVHEIRMGKMKDSIGNVDCVIADVDKDGKVQEFISVELQAVDITGSYMPAYHALINSTVMDAKPSYGMNMANVYKRFVTQLIAKGYFHHHWQTKIVAVVQDVVFEDIMQRAPFLTTSSPKDVNANIVFMVYAYASDGENPGSYRFKLTKAVGTHHSNLQQAVLYKTPPSKAEFCQHIESKLNG